MSPFYFGILCCEQTLICNALCRHMRRNLKCSCMINAMTADFIIFSAICKLLAHGRCYLDVLKPYKFITPSKQFKVESACYKKVHEIVIIFNDRILGPMAC